MKKAILVALAMVLAISAQAESRKTFLLSGGLGLGNSSFDVDADGYGNIFSESGSSFITSLKIGGVINKQHALYYTFLANSFTIEDDYDNELDITAALSGIGYSYYFSPAIKSAFVEVGLGSSVFMFDNGDDEEDHTGSGFMLGLGYQFAKHAEVSLFTMQLEAEDSSFSEIEYSNSSTGIKVDFKL